MQTRGIRILVAGKYIRVLVTMHGITPVVNDLQEVIGYPSAYLHHSGLYTTAHRVRFRFISVSRGFESQRPNRIEGKILKIARFSTILTNP